MYNTWGYSFGQNVPKKLFSSLNWSKNTHFGGSGPGSSNFGVGNFKDIANFHRYFENVGTSASKCGRRQSSILSDRRPLEFFFGVATKKCKKKLLIKCSFLEICSKGEISRIGRCETSRPDVSENVELIGRVRF